jgi:hypothetical protein
MQRFCLSALLALSVFWGCASWVPVEQPELEQGERFTRIELPDTVLYLNEFRVTPDSLFGRSWNDDETVALDRREIRSIEYWHRKLGFANSLLFLFVGSVLISLLFI